MESKVQKQGFTLVELMFALVISIFVAAGVFKVYNWSAELGTLCGKKNRSQVAAMNSSIRMMDCIRNASAISDIDTVEGRWVELTYPDGGTAVLAYTNAPGVANSGALGLFRSGEPTVWLVSSGITEMMGAQGFDSVVFYMLDERPNVLYVRYRVSQPSDIGGRDLNDANYAMHVRFAACLRNAAN